MAIEIYETFVGKKQFHISNLVSIAAHRYPEKKNAIAQRNFLYHFFYLRLLFYVLEYVFSSNILELAILGVIP